MQQAKICLIYLDAFSKLGFHRFKKEDLLTIGQALASFLVKYQAIFKTNHRVEALKNIVTNRLST